MPIYIIFIAEGVEFIFKSIKYKKIVLVLMLLLVAPDLSSEFLRLKDPTFYFFEESRPVIQYLARKKHKTEFVFVPDQSVPPFQYYSKRMNFLQGDSLTNRVSVFTQNNLKEKIRELPSEGRLWLFRTNISPEYNTYILDEMNRSAKLLDSFSIKGARVDLFQLIN
ncbi:MAG: hypothetical protein WC450_12590 [Candidatus Omnitrophota bacterium]|jgi:hypothetical protein